MIIFIIVLGVAVLFLGFLVIKNFISPKKVDALPRLIKQGKTQNATKIAKQNHPEIVLDDGSHMMDDMNATFQYLYPKLQNNQVQSV